MSDDFSQEIDTRIDTGFSLVNRHRKADKYSPVNAGLGNYGLPFYQINFFDRITDPDEFLYSSYYPLMHLHTNSIFMNTQGPFTNLEWTFAGQRETSEQTFRVMHSQNINRKWNFGLIYDIVFSLGQYSYQRSSDKTFRFFTSYTGDKYKLYFNAGINNLYNEENGGLANMADLANINTNRKDIITNLGGLNESFSRLKNRNILLVQRYTISSDPVSKNDTIPHKKSGFLGLSGTFSHIFQYETNARTYQDLYPTSGFYDTIFITPDLTYDSIYSRNIKNTIRFDFTTNESRKFRLGGGFGIRNELHTFGHVIPIPYVWAPYPQEWKRNTNVLLGKLYNNIGDKFSWMANGELFLTGYRAGDFSLIGEINKKFEWKKGKAEWLITGSMLNKQPSFWYDQWGGNNFRWNNNFSKEFRIDVGTAFRYPARHTELRFNYAIINNFMSFDTTAHPSQYSDALSVASFSITNNLRAWKFHLASDLNIQKSSNTGILDLPLFTIRTAAYFEHLFRFASTGGKLNSQIGVDLTYNSLYYAYDYMPATGIFYRQDQIQAGKYPYMNVFVNLKIKRTTLVFMFDHVNADLLTENVQFNYYQTPNYPINGRMFRFGLTWTFYN